MIRFTRHITSALAAVALSALLTGCAQEDIDAPQPVQTVEPGTQLVINLAVPDGGESQAARGSRASGPESAPTDGECAISSLRFIAFSANGTSVVNRALTIPSKMPVNPDGTAIYQIRDVKPGDYRIFIVANLGQRVADVTTEQELRAIMLDYSSSLPQPGSLPMVYEPTAAVKLPDGAATTTPAVLDLSMKFACVKVRCNIIFDKQFAAEAFGDAGLIIDNGGVSASNVSKSAPLITNTALLPDGRTVELQGRYFDNYTETQANASKDNLDVIAVSGNGLAAPTSPTTKWVWQTTLYLPERYATKAADQTTLSIKAHMTGTDGRPGTVHTTYTLPLGGYDGDAASMALPRGTYYEVIAKVKSLGDAELDAQLVVKDWMTQVLSADFIHTFLTLSKTEASVESLVNDEITYRTDGRGGVEFSCSTALPVTSANGKPAIIFDHDPTRQSVTVRVNPDVDVTQLPATQRKGTAECYIKAGNIKKRIDVHYDITPFFIIEPLDLKIQYNTQYDGVLNTKIYTYRTNLGGVRITPTGQPATIKLGNTVKSFSNTVAKSRITLSCANPAAAEGTITVKADCDPITTTVHYFSAYPAKYESLDAEVKEQVRNDLQITVMPPLGPYRIYFRAINDYHHYNGGSSSGEFLGGNYSNYPTEDRGSGDGESANWRDWWKDDTYSNIYNHNHRIYVYTQVGETTGTSTNAPVWKFSPSYGEEQNIYKNGYTYKYEMTGDATNRGWYYYDLPEKLKPVYMDNGASEDRDPKPGETLMIFYSGYDIGLGYTLHRAAHHLDPGIPLFDYEDREGWVVYDPTTEPYYKIYDEKPYIEDVTYVVYSEKKITKWKHNYGVATNDNAITGNPLQFTIQYTIRNSDYTTETINGKTWYRTSIKLKAPRGDYEKAIKLDGLSATPSVENKQYVYYCANNGDKSYDPPYIYLYNSDSDKLSPWNNTPAMNYWKTEGGVKWYRYEIPAKYSSGHVILKRQSYDVSGQGNQTGTRDLNGKSWVNYANNEGYWEEYGSQPVAGNDVILFGGRSFASDGHVATYSNGRWTGGKPK